MDFSKFADFPIEITFCSNEDSLTLRIESCDARAELAGMTGREAVDYLMARMPDSIQELQPKAEFAAKLKPKYEVDICRNGDEPVRVSDKLIAMYFDPPKMGPKGITWYCKLALS